MIKLLSIISFGKRPAYGITYKTLKILFGLKSISKEVNCKIDSFLTMAFFHPQTRTFDQFT